MALAIRQSAIKMHLHISTHLVINKMILDKQPEPGCLAMVPIFRYHVLYKLIHSSGQNKVNIWLTCNKCAMVIAFLFHARLSHIS